MTGAERQRPEVYVTFEGFDSGRTFTPVTLRTDVVALFVDRNGSYPSTVEQWYDDRRDARTYAGSLPIVAHPPCQRWCRLAKLVEARYPHLKAGDDGGLFASALAQLRRVGGVLEHPAYSDAWPAHGLVRPPFGGGWVQSPDDEDEWSCYVEQHAYGHLARKATWLYYVGVRKPFELRWTRTTDQEANALAAPGRGQTRAMRKARTRYPGVCSFLGERKTGTRTQGSAAPKLTKKQAIATPREFQRVLLDLAAWAVRP